MIEVLDYKDERYPKFQAEGNASQFAIPYAKHFCKGNGFDIGCNRIEWSFPGSTPVDKLFDDPYDAYKLPDGKVDYIYSSHCLEHLPSWVDALDYWKSKLVDGGVMFLYLPDHSQKYWRPYNNHKHIHSFTPEIIKGWFEDNMHVVFCSGVDLNNSFMIVGENVDLLN